MSEGLRTDEIQGKIVHVYDGIEEADNELPRWWLATFFIAIIFGVFYWMFYESIPFGDYPHKAFTKARLAAMDDGQEVDDASLIALSEDPPMVAEGKAIFARTCSECHGGNAQGKKDAPNLTDEYWLYGGSPKEIYNTVYNGTTKGMPTWGPTMGNGPVKQVVAYLLTIRNTKVPGNPPAGEKWVPQEDGEDGQGTDDAAEAPSSDEGAGAGTEPAVNKSE